jgi:hypothetical protein
MCEETWFKNAFNWRLWYQDFNDYVRKGKCTFKPEGLTVFQKTVPSDVFYPCLHQAIADEECS